MKTIKKYRINFNSDGNNDMTLVIKTDLTIKEVEARLKEIKQYLYDHLEDDNWPFTCDIEYYQEKMQEMFEIEDENIDDFINFDY